MRALTSSRVMLLRAMARSICVSLSTATSHTASTSLYQPHSIKSGTSSTAAGRFLLRHSARKLCAAASTFLWMIASSFFSASLSWKTSSAILGRLSSPPSVRYSMPKVRAISLSAARPLATRARLSASASNTGAPRLRSKFAIVLLPEAMPPVKPITFIFSPFYFWQCGQYVVPRPPTLVPKSSPPHILQHKPLRPYTSKWFWLSPLLPSPSL